MRRRDRDRDREKRFGSHAPGRIRRGVVLVVALLSATALLRTDHLVEAARPGALAPLIPSRPLVVLETDELPRLLARWRDCQLRRDVEATDVYEQCLASRLLIRLDQRLERLEAALASPLTIDRLARLPADRGGLALYNLGDTAFVLWLRLQPGAVEDMRLLRPGLSVERSERSGQRVLIHRGTDSTSPVAFAIVGQLLIVSNDLRTFRRALALATDDRGQSLADDTTYEEMARRAPVDAQVHLFLDMARLVETEPFQRYWIHGNSEALRGLDRAMLSVTFEEARAVEHRQLSYREVDAQRLPAGSAAGAPIDERLEALPGGTYAEVRAVDAAAGARAARWLWPRAAGSTAQGSENVEPLRALLDRGHVTQVVEVIRPFLDRNWFFPRDRLAVAYALDTPDDLPTKAVVEEASEAFSRSVEGPHGAAPRARRRHVRGLMTQTISSLIPGGADLSIARSRGNAVLVFATDPDLALEVAGAAAPTAPLGQALAAGGPDAARVDFARASRALSKRLDLITSVSGQGPRTGMAAFLGDAVPELLGVPHITRIERIAFRDGSIDRQEVRYVY